MTAYHDCDQVISACHLIVVVVVGIDAETLQVFFSRVSHSRSSSKITNLFQRARARPTMERKRNLSHHSSCHLFVDRFSYRITLGDCDCVPWKFLLVMASSMATAMAVVNMVS